MRMMRKFLRLVVLAEAAGMLAFGQSTAQQKQITTAVGAQQCGLDMKVPSMEPLAAKATNATNIALDPDMLRLAAKFVGNTTEDAQIKQIVNGLKSMYVRTFEFDKPGEYSAIDYEDFRKQLKDPMWTRVLDSKEKSGEVTEIYMRRQGDRLCGMALISAEPKELTMISINGEIDPASIGKLSGALGIPRPNIKGEQKSEQK